ncbi:STAS domain-containing protein [Streptomyces chrestomyceticus]|uniref:STAS domain-containing protein n=1 Tax=Streptomyces chrestomyceticus TaxID=68185 RepID=A0ABU7X3D8_9ACTN
MSTQDYAMVKIPHHVAGFPALPDSRNVSEPNGHTPPYAVQGFTVIELRGEIDLVSAAHAGALLEAAFTLPGPRMLADIRPVNFFDCSALSLLCRTRRRTLAYGGYLGLVCAHPWHLRILNTAGLNEALCPQPTLEESVAAALLHYEERPCT